MEGRVCLITGGSSGVGLAVARALAPQKATLLLLCRDQEYAERVRQQLMAETGSRTIQLVACDLAEGDSVHRAAERVLKAHGSLHLVANCAGSLFTTRRTNSAGVELTFATEVLGHFLLDNLLRERLVASAPARVITGVGNPGRLRRRSLRLEELRVEGRYHPIRVKLQAALAKVLFTFELARRLEGTGVTANAFHPGLVRSRLTRNLPGLLQAVGGLAMSVLSTDSSTAAYVAAAPQLEGVTGRYFARRSAVPFPERREEAAELWARAAELTHLGS